MSVIIPCFNRPNDLARAIESVLAQSYQDFEVVVGDDASTDDLRPVVERAADDRIQIARREDNAGIGGGRNVAVAVAAGELFAFLDSDDEWLPNMLETQVAELDRDPDIAAVCTAFEMSYASGRRSIRTPPPDLDVVERVVRGVDLSAGSTMMVRADAWRAVGPWTEDIRRYEDYDWFLRFGRQFRLRVVPEVCCRIYANDRAPLNLEEAAPAVEWLLSRHEEWLRERNPALARAFHATLEQELAWVGWRSRSPGVFITHLAKAVSADPITRARNLAGKLYDRVRSKLLRQIR